jgi:hypothetical protein
MKLKKGIPWQEQVLISAPFSMANPQLKTYGVMNSCNTMSREF